jgi:hypothetical protein
MKTRSPLSDEERERAKVLRASGKTPTAIARGMNRSHHTLQKFLNRPETREQVAVQRQELAGMFDGVAHRIVDSVNDTDIQKSNLVQKMTSAGIAVDKAAILRNELPQSIDVHVLLHLAAIVRGDLPNQPQPTPVLPLPEKK